ncbi:MAG TPA: hypothetical protein VGG69_05840 [Rhizomicrobium sp.]
MASREKTELLRSFLGSLPVSIATRVARAVEVDKLNNGRVLPHELILESLRPTLRTSADHATRTPTPLRVFCRPFEDLLTNEARTQKQKGRILRSSITPVWNWLAQELIPDVLNAYAISVKTAILGYRADEMRDRTAEFWKAAAAAIRTKLATDAGCKAARVALNGDAAVEDAREIALMLSAAPDICELQDRLPQQIPSLTEDAIHAFRSVYDRLAETAPDAAPYLPLVVMNRLEKPWEALRLPLSISGKTQETMIANTDMGLVGEILFAAIETHCSAIRAAKPQQFNADALLASVARFTTLSSGVVKEVELRRDGVWGQRLIKDRAAVAEVMDGFMERAPKEVLTALPMQNMGSNGPKTPDFSHPADAEKCDRAISYARLLAGCRPFASAASFAASLKRADDEIGMTLRSYNEEVVRELHGASDEKRLNAEQFAAVATELTALLFSAEEGEFLRRRGRAIIAPVAA